MSVDIISDTWRCYRKRGLLPLVHSITSDVFRFAPLRYRVAYRRAIGTLKYGDDAGPQPLKIHWISPDRIRSNGPIFKPAKYIGRCLDGDWDTNPSELKDEWMYLGLYERFAKGYDWEETQYYKRSKEKLDSGDVWLGYDSFEAFENHRLRYLDEMYASIKEDGYKTQSEISREDMDPIRDNQQSEINEITCNIDREGKLLLNDGMHRISIAKILDIDEIPIQIIVRHRNWQKKRVSIAQARNSLEEAERYDIDTTHPDLERILPT